MHEHIDEKLLLNMIAKAAVNFTSTESFNSKIFVFVQNKGESLELLKMCII
jgi:hypothetical protein